MSDSGLVGVNYGFKIEFLKDLHEQRQSVPYMRHNCSSKYRVNNFKFVPFEDLVGLGSSKGFTSLIVPGSGMPYYDSFENNPFESKKQKREALVHNLLEKLPPETITVDTGVIGGMSRLSKEELEKEEKEERERKQREHIEKVMAKKKAKGRSKLSKKVRIARFSSTSDKSRWTRLSGWNSPRWSMPDCGPSGPRGRKRKASCPSSSKCRVRAWGLLICWAGRSRRRSEFYDLIWVSNTSDI